MTADDHLIAERVVAHGPASNHVRIYGIDSGRGEYVSVLPSLGRGVEDYTEQYESTITTRLVEAGYRVILIQPRGIGRSTGDLTPENASMGLFARDIKAVLDNLGIEKVNLIGHAWGNRLARTFSTLYPDYVDKLALLAAGGGDEKSEQQMTCLKSSFDLALDESKRLDAVGRAFFAKGNDPRIWLDGWYPALARAQLLAAERIDGDFFKKAAGKPFLLVQAEEDFISPPDTAGKPLARELGNQVTYVEIPHAGHALTSERPDAIATYVIDYFRQ